MAESKRINTSDLVGSVAEKTGYPKAQVEKILKAYKQEIQAVIPTLEEKDSLEVLGLGRVHCMNTKATTKINPKTKEAVDVPSHKKLSFKSSQTIVNLYKA